MFSLLNNIPQVTRNILILNVLMYLATLYFDTQGINLRQILGVYNFNSPKFEPFQIITHFFMHADFLHVFMNMWLLLMMGTYLERLWGPKRFLIFYSISAIGALVLDNITGVYQIHELHNMLSSYVNMGELDDIISFSLNNSELEKNVNALLNTSPSSHGINMDALSNYISYCRSNMIGASGAVFGIMAAFAILFPNTEFYLYMAIPVKAKFLVGGYFLWELYRSFNGLPGDNVAHLAHVGGAVAGAVTILIWRRTDRKNFW